MESLRLFESLDQKTIPNRAQPENTVSFTQVAFFDAHFYCFCLCLVLLISLSECLVVVVLGVLELVSSRF